MYWSVAKIHWSKKYVWRCQKMHHKQPWGHYNPLESLMIGPVGGIAMCHTNCGNCTRLSLCSDLWQIRFHPVTQLRVRASQFFWTKSLQTSHSLQNENFLTPWRLKTTTNELKFWRKLYSGREIFFPNLKTLKSLHYSFSGPFLTFWVNICLSLTAHYQGRSNGKIFGGGHLKIGGAQRGYFRNFGRFYGFFIAISEIIGGARAPPAPLVTTPLNAKAYFSFQKKGQY